MLIKEYHILLPMSLDEYQVAQLYMIQPKLWQVEVLFVKKSQFFIPNNP